MAEQTCAEKLAQLKEVRQQLLAGQLVAEAQYEGRRVRYQQTDLATINGEISKLEAECGDVNKARRPFTTSFGHR